MKFHQMQLQLWTVDPDPLLAPGEMKRSQAGSSLVINPDTVGYGHPTVVGVRSVISQLETAPRTVSLANSLALKPVKILKPPLRP
jgi:hypothetical protein